MRNLNEPIARQANEEEHGKGCFWESRYNSQALLDEAALLSCMACVDLNPVRASIADTPEASDFTSVQWTIVGAGANLLHRRLLDTTHIASRHFTLLSEVLLTSIFSLTDTDSSMA